MANPAEIAELEARYDAIVRRTIEHAALVISATPYLSEDPAYRFRIPEDGDIKVIDPNFQRPQRLANWLTDLVEFSNIPLEPADTLDLALDVQRRLTTEQGDFTTLMILSDAKAYVPKSRGRKAA